MKNFIKTQPYKIFSVVLFFGFSIFCDSNFFVCFGNFKKRGTNGTHAVTRIKAFDRFGQKPEIRNLDSRCSFLESQLANVIYIPPCIQIAYTIYKIFVFSFLIPFLCMFFSKWCTRRVWSVAFWVHPTNNNWPVKLLTDKIM